MNVFFPSLEVNGFVIENFKEKSVIGIGLDHERKTFPIFITHIEVYDINDNETHVARVEHVATTEKANGALIANGYWFTEKNPKGLVKINNKKIPSAGKYKDYGLFLFLDEKVNPEKLNKIVINYKYLFWPFTKTYKINAGDEVIGQQDNTAPKDLTVNEPSSQITPWHIKFLDIQENIKYNNGASIKIAIIDSGIQEHPDLEIKGGHSFIKNSKYYEDGIGHGTTVAGVIGAKDNDVGIIGVSNKADIYSVKILDETGQGTYQNLIKAIQWCIDNKMNIINLSLKGEIHSPYLEEVIEKASNSDIIIVAASRNGGSNRASFPANYQNVLSISSVNQKGENPLPSTGNKIDYFAPGDAIYTTSKWGFEFTSGNSMAAAFATGQIAQIWSSNPRLTANEIKKILSETSTNDKGIRLINLNKAINYIQKKS